MLLWSTLHAQLMRLPVSKVLCGIAASLFLSRYHLPNCGPISLTHRIIWTSEQQIAMNLLGHIGCIIFGNVNATIICLVVRSPALFILRYIGMTGSQYHNWRSWTRNRVLAVAPFNTHWPKVEVDWTVCGRVCQYKNFPLMHRIIWTSEQQIAMNLLGYYIGCIL